MTIPLKCHCGTVKGVLNNVTRDSGKRMICMCDDCQLYAYSLDRARYILDPNGGTEIYMVRPADLQITSGLEKLSCIRLSEKGMYRWFAGCCKTPIGNTLASSKFPYVGLTASFVDQKTEPRSDSLWPDLFRVMGKFGKAPLPKGTAQGMPARLLVYLVGFLASGFLKGKNKPSPFFTSEGKPVIEPYVLTASENERFRKMAQGPN